MEDLIQILVFFAIIGFTVARKAKEVKANRPGQAVPQTKTDYELPDLPKEDEDIEDFKEASETEEPFPTNKKRPQPVFSDFFPHQKPDSEDSQEKTAPPMQPAFRSNFHPTTMEKKSSQPSAEPAKGTPSITGKKRKGLHIHLSTRSEARKAFIYSEIFNKKYE